MNGRVITREMRRQLERDNAKQPARLTQVPIGDFPRNDSTLFAAYRSRNFLVQLFNECGVVRVSVNRTSVNSAGGWIDGIAWDELMEIKRQLGMGDKYAIEVLPQDKEIVNVANMRHFFVLPEPLQYGWFRK
jgi:hypothetical protein